MPTVTIRRRWFSSLPPITVEIGAEYENDSDGVKLGAAIKVIVGKAEETETRADLTGAVLTDAVLTRAVLTRAVLTDADLTRAVLTRAVLTDAVLTDAVLTRAVLTRAVLTDADLTRAVLTRAVLTDADLTGAKNIPEAALRPIRADLFDVLLRAKAEVPFLLAALRSGTIDGSTYHGACACLAGTIANTRHCAIGDLGFSDSNRPAERWFLAIKPGNTPENHPIAKITEGWIVEFMQLAGIAAVARTDAA